MIKFDILNRFTNTIQFTAEIDCEEGELNSVKLGLSIKRALENDANLSYANLSDAYPVSYTHLRAHETSLHLVCRLLLEKRSPHTERG